MPAENPDEMRVFPSPGFAAWRALVWAALLLFVFNFWAIVLHHWSSALAFEVPSSSALAEGHWWTLLSYALTSAGTGVDAQWLSGPVSLLFLVLAAQLADRELIRRDFLLLCAVCAIGGVACWLPLHWASADSLHAGCTVLVFGLGSFLCFAVPDESMPLRLFFSLEVRPQAFFWLALALETGAFLCFELPQAFGHPGVFIGDYYYSAQLGAMLAGWACARFLLREETEEGLSPAPARASRRPAVHVGAARTTEPDSAAKSAPANRRELREAVDRILDKINHDGFESLSPQERQFLKRVKDLLRK